MRTTGTDVIVVGTGLAALSAAAGSALHGYRTTVLGRRAAGSNELRAALIDARTLELLERLGVTERLIARGWQTPRATVRDQDRTLVPVQCGTRPRRYASASMLAGAEMEAALRDRLTDLGSRVQWEREVTNVSQTTGFATATLADGSRVRGRYLVAADDMPRLRQSLATPFEGETYRRAFSLADVRLSSGAPTHEAILYCSPASLVMVAPLAGGLHRIVAAVDAAPRTPDRAFVQALLDARGTQRTTFHVEHVVGGSRVRVHRRVARTERVGRVLLAGGAAHLQGPAGGRGMNEGIQDGIGLADALACALRTRDDRPLDEYAHAHRFGDVARLTDCLSHLATLRRLPRTSSNTALLFRKAANRAASAPPPELNYVPSGTRRTFRMPPYAPA
jgi:2-polyprenyl-6-methoxyphenol hydroxylase-like FAD-dependent oxidoreductase